MAGCVFGYFADCTVVYFGNWCINKVIIIIMPLFLLIAILQNVGVGMPRFEWSSMGIVTGGLALAEEPTFHNVFRLPVNKKCAKK